MTDEELWTVEQVAAYLKLNPETIRRWVRRGDIQAISLGEARNAPLRIRQSEVERVSRGRQAAPCG